MRSAYRVAAFFGVWLARAMQRKVKVICVCKASPRSFVLGQGEPLARDARDARERAGVVDEAEDVEGDLDGQVGEKVALEEGRDAGGDEKEFARVAVRE